jgi:hypothetical protein
MGREREHFLQASSASVRNDLQHFLPSSTATFVAHIVIIIIGLLIKFPLHGAPPENERKEEEEERSWLCAVHVCVCVWCACQCSSASNKP